MSGGIFMRGIWTWMAAILAAITACAWIFLMTNREPSNDLSQVADNGAQGTTVCLSVNGKLQCSASTIWAPAMPFERMLMEMNQHSR
jgi:hypothetical protein